MGRKRRYLWIIAAAVLILVGIHLAGGSECWLQWRKASMQERIKESFTEHSDGYASFAQQMREYSAGGQDFAYYDNPSLALPEDGILRTRKFLEETGIPYDSIYMGGMTQNVYPADACVFRYTIAAGDRVYCWLDLVSSCQEEPFRDFSGAVQLSPEWYMVVFWGF